MYTFKPITERVARLRDAVRDRLIVGDVAKDRLQLEALKKYRKYPPMLQTKLSHWLLMLDMEEKMQVRSALFRRKRT